MKVLDAEGNEIELKDEDEDTYQPGSRDDYYDRDDDYDYPPDKAELDMAGYRVKYRGSDGEEYDEIDEIIEPELDTLLKKSDENDYEKQQNRYSDDTEDLDYDDEGFITGGRTKLPEE